MAHHNLVWSALVHAEYCLPLYWNGNVQFAPFALPPVVEIAPAPTARASTATAVERVGPIVRSVEAWSCRRCQLVLRFTHLCQKIMVDTQDVCTAAGGAKPAQRASYGCSKSRQPTNAVIESTAGGILRRTLCRRITILDVPGEDGRWKYIAEPPFPPASLSPFYL